MYKLMLVDDEDEVREGITQTVDFAACGFVLCAQATGAIDALEKAARYQPDVVFTDVHMPYMDGMEMISRLQEMYPTMKYIVLSGYDDFMYVKQALQRQVMDYLLKPLSAQGIMKVLRRAKEELDEQNRRRVNLEVLKAKVVENEQQLRRSVILEYLVGGAVDDTHALCAYPMPEDEQISFPMVLGVLFLERTEENLNVLRRDFDNQPLLLGASVSEVLSEVFKRHAGESIEFRRQFLLLLPLRQEEAMVVCNDVLQSLKHYLHLEATIGLSEEVAGYASLAEGYRTALTALDKRLLGGEGSVYTLRRSSENRQLEIDQDQRVSQVCALCRGGTAEEIDAYYEGLMQDIARNGMELPLRMLLLTGLLAAIFNTASHAGLNIAEITASFRTEMILQPMNLSQTMEQLKGLTLSVADAMRREVAGTGEEMIRQAAALAKERMADKELSLESVCAEFHVSQTQFSLLFKREMGTSFLQYLLDLRIEAAQDQLKNSSKKIYQIAEDTGFGDASYFSYCFKQRCGLSPKEYRLQGGT